MNPYLQLILGALLFGWIVADILWMWIRTDLLRAELLSIRMKVQSIKGDSIAYQSALTDAIDFLVRNADYLSTLTLTLAFLAPTKKGKRDETPMSKPETKDAAERLFWFVTILKTLTRTPAETLSPGLRKARREVMVVVIVHFLASYSTWIVVLAITIFGLWGKSMKRISAILDSVQPSPGPLHPQGL